MGADNFIDTTKEDWHKDYSVSRSCNSDARFSMLVCEKDANSIIVYV